MFYDRFMELCAGKGITPGRAASQIGFNRASVNVWKKSGKPPKQELLVKIASFFDVSTDYLLGLEEADPRAAEAIPVLGRVQAGVPVSAVEDVIGYEELGPSMADRGELFALRIKGSSMEPRFREGDTVIIRKQSTADTGDIVVALVGRSDATIKKLRRMNDGIMLQPLNPDFEPMFFSNEDIDALPVQILGRVIELRARF